MPKLSGAALREAFQAAARALERYRDAVNALNVFPVPDGDTGTNMLLTLRAALGKLPTEPDPAAGAVAAAAADGAFWGARGNSGVIFSQYLKGFAEGLEKAESFGGAELAKGWQKATQAAYQAVGKPVEGTMLTVIRAAGEAARREVDAGETDAAAVWEAAFDGAREALHRTPELLPVLAQAGVVDAGGMGVVVILGGSLCHLTNGRSEDLDATVNAGRTGNPPAAPVKLGAAYLDATEHQQWGYCAQFIVTGENLNPAAARERLAAIADSIVVIGDSRNLRAHVHALDPGPLLSYGVSLGSLSEIKIENMSRQNQDFVAGHRARQAPPALAVVAVAPGEGLAQLFRENGCAAVVSGGQTMNPSVLQLLDAVNVAGAQDTIILPNNKNIVAAAQQAAQANGRLHIITTRTAPQGVAALLAFNPEASLERNLKAMADAAAQVTTLEVTQAVRDANLDGQTVAAGQFMALQDEALATTGDSAEAALSAALASLDLTRDQVTTLYWGAGASQEQAETLRAEWQARVPGLQVDVVYGGQPHYQYLASVE